MTIVNLAQKSTGGLGQVMLAIERSGSGDCLYFRTMGGSPAVWSSWTKVANSADVEAVREALDNLDIETDKTLSIDGKPADAKATGDEINNLKADLSKIGAMTIVAPSWRNGYINSNGVIAGTTGNGRHTQPFYAKKNDVIIVTGYGYNQSTSIINKVITDEESYSPLVMSIDSTERTYKYIVEESGYYAVSVSIVKSATWVAVSYNFDADNDTSNPLDTVLTKHEFNVTANTPTTEFFNYKASKGDKLALKLDIGFTATRNVAWYYKDRSNNNHMIVQTVTYTPYLFTAPEDITSIGIYISDALIPETTIYTMKVRKLSALGVLSNDIYITPENGLYATIKSIKDCDRYNPYIIHLAKGTYDVSAEFTDAEIQSANYSNDGFVGLCLTDGMYLVGDNEKDTIIVSCDIPTTYSQTIRNQISTINTKGECGAENITFKSNNIRYTVHDDYVMNTNSKHIFKNCDFIHTNGTGAFAYGNGMNSGAYVELNACSFTPSVLSHLTASSIGWPKGSNFILKDCKAKSVTIRNADTKIKCLSKFIDCEIDIVIYTTPIETQHLNIEGVNTNALFSAPNGTIYSIGSVYKVPKGTFETGLCLDYNMSIANALPYWIVIGVDNEYAYLQHGGCISSRILNLTNGNIGDYLTITNGHIAIGGTEENAIAKIIAVTNDEFFIRMI